MKRLFIAVMAAAGLMASAADYTFDRDIPYRDTKGDGYAEKMCRLDVATTSPDAKKPVIVWFHGGGLTGGMRRFPNELFNDSLVVVTVEYRLSPNVTIDEIIDDAAAATAWVFNNIEKYGGDTENIFLSGHSAGGYLIDMIGLDKSRLAPYGIDADQIAGLIPFSGQVITHYEARNRQGIPPLQPTIDNLAPLYHVRGDCPPILIISGDRDKELFGRYEEQAYFWRMLQLVGHKDARLLEMQGYDHGGMPYPAFPITLEFIRNHTRR